MIIEQVEENIRRNPDYLDQLITEHEAAGFLNYSTRALQNWRVRGGGPRYIKVSKKSIRYRRRELIDWAQSKLRTSSSQKAP